MPNTESQRAALASLPTLAPYPGSKHVPWSQIPLGVGLNGEIVWDVAYSPNILVVGNAGQGKSMLQKIIQLHCLQHADDWLVLGVDVLAAEPLLAANLATTVLDGLANINSAVFSMRDNYARMKQYALATSTPVNNFEALPDPPRAILLMINDLHAFLSALGEISDGHRRHAIALLGEIARLGRAAGVHLLVSSQQPGAAAIPVELRENLHVRYVVGPMTPLASLVALDSNFASSTADIKGRAAMRVHGEEVTPIQGYFVSGSVGKILDMKTAQPLKR